MKALIVTPYFNHLGGGERYMLQAASIIESLGYQLFFAWDDAAQITKLTKMLDIKLNDPQLDPQILPLYSSHNPLAMYMATRTYDLVLYLSDGSIPLLGGKKNILHLQVPFHNVGGRKLTTQFKLRNIKEVIVNSNFTKSVIDKEFDLKSLVVYPPITPISAVEKKNIILSVGRFEPSINIKKQDILINAFKELSPQLPGWRLALAGSSADEAWLNKLQTMASGFPIDFYSNLEYSKLTSLYAHAKVYWHGAGFGVDQETNPELVEHLGITTAEAITAGCIPLVVAKGGQVEVVPDSNYHWETIDQLSELTLKAAAGELSQVSLPESLSAGSFATKLKEVIGE